MIYIYNAGPLFTEADIKQRKYEGAKFSTYAYQYIIGEVTNFIRENNPIKISKDVVRLSKEINKCSSWKSA